MDIESCYRTQPVRFIPEVSTSSTISCNPLPPMTVGETTVEMTELVNPAHTDSNGCI